MSDDRLQLAALGAHLATRPPEDMGADAYQALAMRTSSAHDTPDHRLINAALGLVGEAGEIAGPIGLALDGDLLAARVLDLAADVGAVADMVKKARYHGRPLNHAQIERRCADIRRSAELVAQAAAQNYLYGPPAREALRVDDLDPAPLRAELGDVGWYLAQAADSRGWQLADVLQGNIAKLRARWPAGFVTEDQP